MEAVHVLYLITVTAQCVLTPSCAVRVLLQNLIFRFFTNKSRVQLWLYEQPDLRIEGRIMVNMKLLALVRMCIGDGVCIDCAACKDPEFQVT